MAKFRVLSPLKLDPKSGKIIQPGATVDLDPDDAVELIACGTVEDLKAPKAAAGNGAA